jgi:hypothetical protein
MSSALSDHEVWYLRIFNWCRRRAAWASIPLHGMAPFLIAVARDPATAFIKPDYSKNKESVTQLMNPRGYLGSHAMAEKGVQLPFVRLVRS